MKTIRYSMYAIAAAAIALAPRAYAFHSGGVAECEGCHTMHNTKGSGKSVPLAGGAGNGAAYLLQGSDQSSTCLNCHNSADTTPSSYHISTDDSMFTTVGSSTVFADPTNKPPVEMTPGGDFGWLKVTRYGKIRGSPFTNEGSSHGHNIVAGDYSYPAATGTAPGGTYPAANLACSSCHDPHGRYRRFADGTVGTTGLPTFNSGSYNSSAAPIAGVSAVGVYRLLAGVGYQPKSLTGNFTFTASSPVAVVNSSYNRPEGNDSNVVLPTGWAAGQTHVAYGSGMSEWCANCHTSMLENGYSNGVAGHRHPAGNSAKLTQAIVDNYNSYVSSGRLTNSDMTKAYSTLAPFELGKGTSLTDIAALQALAVNTDTKDQSASTSANVACVTCHRAHASGFGEGTRFFLENELMTIADGSNNGIYDPSQTENKINYGYNQKEQAYAYYGRPASVFGPNARNYCNKCHAKD